MEESFYQTISNILQHARNSVYRTANTEMVNAYWNIGKAIVHEQGGTDKAEYGQKLIGELSARMTLSSSERGLLLQILGTCASSISLSKTKRHCTAN